MLTNYSVNYDFKMLFLFEWCSKLKSEKYVNIDRYKPNGRNPHNSLYLPVCCGSQSSHFILSLAPRKVGK